MRDKGAWSSRSYESTHSEVKREGSATYKGEQRAKQGKGLDSLVDPKTHDGYRESNNLLVPKGNKFLLKENIAMPVMTGLDTTGSMGDNVNIAFSVLPDLLKLLVLDERAVLRNRYHTQICTSVIQDIADNFPFQISEFEPDNEVEKQMQLLVPESQGGDNTEDYQISLYAAAFRVKTSIVKYSLKGYYFIVGDEIGREQLTVSDARKIFGDVDMPQSDIPVRTLGKTVLSKWHAFFLQVGGSGYITDYWAKIFGKERTVLLPHTEDLAQVQAVIIGLTEGIFDLQNAADFLCEVASTKKEKARQIVRAVSNIPLRAQADLPNFKKLPRAGSLFASREDVWPIDHNAGDDESSLASAVSVSASEEIDWQL
ncbi:MAG: hypothetical protein Q8Q23_02510 [bacterium]|nr:hypothetical protein [bacterium]